MTFTAQEKAIFEYQDPATGARRYADPMAVDRALAAHTHGECDRLVADLHGTDPVKRLAAGDLLWPAVRAAFGLAPFDAATGKGATDAVCNRLLGDYNGWANEVFTGGGTGPTFVPPTDSPAAPRATKSSSDCGCA